MFAVLIVGIVMAVFSAVMWVVEALPFVKVVKSLKAPKSSLDLIGSAKFSTGFIKASITLWPLALDVLCTVWLAGAFGFTGLIGGVIGLSISNVISVFLLSVRGKTNG